MGQAVGEEELRNIIREELSKVKQELVEEVKQELGSVKQELGDRIERLERQVELQGDRIERLERQVELQDLSFRALVKAAKASQEVEEELEGTYVREGTGFNTKRIKWVRDPLA